MAIDKRIFLISAIMINVLHILFLYSYIQLFKRPNVVFMIHKLIMDLLINIFQKNNFIKVF